VITLTNRKLLLNPLILKNGKYEIDFEGVRIYLRLEMEGYYFFATLTTQ
jgi:bifunctional pyridoxal-dependent enzyme with beta-cystathionase and maltose regulon repressor activities